MEYHDASFWIQFRRMGFVLSNHDCSLEVVGNIYKDGGECDGTTVDYIE